MSKYMLILLAVFVGACAEEEELGAPPAVSSCSLGHDDTIPLGQEMPPVHITWENGPWAYLVSVDGVEVDLTKGEYVAVFRCGEGIRVHALSAAPNIYILMKAANNLPPVNNGTRPYFSHWEPAGDGWVLSGYGPELEQWNTQGDMLIAGVTEQNYWWLNCRKRTLDQGKWGSTCDNKIQAPAGYVNGISGSEGVPADEWQVHDGGTD